MPRDISSREQVESNFNFAEWARMGAKAHRTTIVNPLDGPIAHGGGSKSKKGKKPPKKAASYLWEQL